MKSRTNSNVRAKASTSNGAAPPAAAPRSCGSPASLLPQWVELVRTGNAVSAYYSSNGTAWTQIGTAQTITLSPADLAGVAVSAINSAGLYTAAFNGMAVSNADSRRVPAVALLPPLERETVTCAVANAAWSE